MKKYSYLLAAAMLACASCSEESIFESTLTGKNVINATFEQSATGSRVALVQGDNDALSLKWTAGDAIAVFGEDGTKAVYTLDAASIGQASGSFVGTGAIEGNVRGVAYPYNEVEGASNVECNQGADLNITLPAEITFDPNEPAKCNVPMWGELSNNGSVSFKHLGSLLKIDFTDMPVGYDQLIVSSSSPISGTFSVKVDSNEPILLMGTPSADNQKVTIKFAALTDADTENDKVFYLPLPSGNYASLNVAIGKSTDANANLVLRNWTNIAFERAKYYTAAVAYVAVTGNDVDAINTALTSAISDDNTTAQLVMEEAITAGGEISVPENSTNVSLDFTSVSGTTSTAPLTINSDASATQGEATKTLSLNVPTTDDEGSYVTVNTPTSTVNLNGGKFHTLTATTATNTLIVGDGVEITNLTVVKGNIRIKEGGTITNLTYSGDEDIYVVLEGNASKPNNITDTNSRVKVVSSAEYDLANQPEGTVYNFTSDMILTQPLYIENDVTIELNGYRITHCGESFTDPNNDKALVVVKRGGKLTVNNKTGDGRISVLGFDDNHDINPSTNNTNIHAAIKMTAAGESSTGETASLILHNGYIEGNYYSITGNGNRHDTYIEINGGWISSLGGEFHQEFNSETLGIYHPQNGVLKINGGTIKGYESAVEMRGGELIAENATFEVEGATTEFSTRPNSNGNTVIGAAIAVSPHQGRNVKATIKNASLKGPRALHEEYMYEGEVPQIELLMENATIYDWDVNHPGIIYSENCTEFVKGTVWAKNSSILNYLGDNAQVFIENDMTDLGKSIKITADKVTIDLKKHTITTLATDVFEVTGSLVLNDTGNGGIASVHAGTDTDNTGSVCAVWAYDGGSVTINGGQYRVGKDKDGKRNDCIYAGSNAKGTAGSIVINGGDFAFDWAGVRPEGTVAAENDGDRFLLNCADSTPASSIIVNGGLFTNHVPGCEPTGEGVKLGDGKTVYYKESAYAPDGAELNVAVTTSYISNNTTSTYKYEVR